jgi:hypothetical protein
VVFDSAKVALGESGVLTARLSNSQSLIVLTLPLAYTAGEVTLDSVSWVSSRTDYDAYGTSDADSAAGRILVSLSALEEPYISPGEGVLAEFHFSALPGAVDGGSAVLDTAFFPPSNYVIVRNPAHDDLPLYFVPGLIELYQPNRPPVIEVAEQQFVNEGQPLEFSVTVTDLDGDTVSVSAAGLPTTATFTEASAGVYEFSWTPDYVGAMSSAASPFAVTFHGTDGEWPVSKAVQLWVGNVNRTPQLTLPAPVTVDVGDTIKITVGAVDLDADPLAIYCLDRVDGDSLWGANPWTYARPTTEADIGETALRFVCEDDYGASDTVSVDVTVLSIVGYRLQVGNVAGGGGETVELDVSLFTVDSIGGADLLIHYDPTALTFEGIDRTGAGMESWEFFDVSEAGDVAGRNIHIVGIADMDNGIPSPGLPPSDTVLFRIRFTLSIEPQYYGHALPVSFKMVTEDDNVLSTADAVLITQEQIDYVSGTVLIQEPPGLLIGDINLNGIAFEISDAVRLTNYFIYGLNAGLDPVQMANADCNQDGLMATVSDLVYLILVLLDQAGP